MYGWVPETITTLFLIINLFIFTWRVTALQYCVGFCHTSKWITGIYMFPPSWTPSQLPPHLIPPGCHRAPGLCSLHHTADSHWLSILHVVIHICQCCSLSASYPLPPLWPQGCSLRLHLHRCPADRLISTICLDSYHNTGDWLHSKTTFKNKSAPLWGIERKYFNFLFNPT